MNIRKIIFPLDGIRISILLLVALALALIISISIPRPAHAEGILEGTVKCVLRILLPGDCKKASTQLATNPADTPAAPSSKPPATGTSQNAQPSGNNETPSAAPTTIQRQTIALPQFESMAIEPPAPLPAVNSVNRRVNTNSVGAAYLAYTNTHSIYDQQGIHGAQSRQAAALAEGSHEGWRIAGIAWYWWILGLLLIGGVISYGKYKLVKKNTSLSKAG